MFAGQFLDTSLQQWNGFRKTSTSMWWLKGLNAMAGNSYYLPDFHHYHPTSLTMLFQPQMFDFSEIFSFPQLLAAYQ
jgi:hypothetical protein